MRPGAPLFRPGLADDRARLCRRVAGGAVLAAHRTSARAMATYTAAPAARPLRNHKAGMRTRPPEIRPPGAGARVAAPGT